MCDPIRGSIDSKVTLLKLTSLRHILTSVVYRTRAYYKELSLTSNSDDKVFSILIYYTGLQRAEP